MNLYEIVLPRNYNDGTPVESEKYDQTLEELIEQFGGAEFFESPYTGHWRSGAIAYQDLNVLMRVECAGHNEGFWAAYKSLLEKRFKQEEIRIRRQQIDIL